MNSGATAERVYDAVKQQILTGAFAPGERIEVAALAQALNSSATPIRDALHLLAGERLVETRAGDGFHAPLIDASSLTDRYEWNAGILLQALRSRRGDHKDQANLGASGGSDPAEVVGRVFVSIAGLTGNGEYACEIRAINDRLYAARIAESFVLQDWHDEIAALEHELARQNVTTLRRLITAYHRRRQRVVMDILRSLHSLRAPHAEPR